MVHEGQRTSQIASSPLWPENRGRRQKPWLQAPALCSQELCALPLFGLQSVQLFKVWHRELSLLDLLRSMAPPYPTFSTGETFLPLCFWHLKQMQRGAQSFLHQNAPKMWGQRGRYNNRADPTQALLLVGMPRKLRLASLSPGQAWMPMGMERCLRSTPTGLTCAETAATSREIRAG